MLHGPLRVPGPHFENHSSMVFPMVYYSITKRQEDRIAYKPSNLRHVHSNLRQFHIYYRRTLVKCKQTKTFEDILDKDF